MSQEAILQYTCDAINEDSYFFSGQYVIRVYRNGKMITHSYCFATDVDKEMEDLEANGYKRAFVPEQYAAKLHAAQEHLRIAGEEYEHACINALYKPDIKN